MITNITGRDMFQEQAPNKHGAGNVLILASEEYINQQFKLKPGEGGPDVYRERQLGHAQALFAQIRDDKDFSQKYRTVAGKNNLSIVILATTDEGVANAINYVREVLEADPNT